MLPDSGDGASDTIHAFRKGEERKGPRNIHVAAASPPASWVLLTMYPQDHGKCVHISVNTHSNPEKKTVLFLIYDLTVQTLAVVETNRRSNQDYRESGVTTQQSALLLSTPASSWSAWPSLAQLKEVTKV